MSGFPLLTKGISWDPATVDSESQPLSEGVLVGYMLGIRPDQDPAYGPGVYKYTITIMDPAVTMETKEDLLRAVGGSLPPGNYWFSITALASPPVPELGDSNWCPEQGFSL